MPDDTATLAAKPPARVPASAAPPQESLVAIVVGVVVVVALYLGREVLIPITLAILLSFLLAPLVRLLRRIHLPRVPSVLLSVAAALLVILLLGGLIGTQVADLARGLPQYQSTIMSKVGAARRFTVGRLDQVISHMGHVASDTAPSPAPAAEPSGPKPTLVQVQQPSPTPLELAQRYLEPILSPIETLGVVLVVAIFILMQQEDLRDRLIRLFGSSDLHRTTLAIDDAGHRLSRYFLTQAAINACFGLIIGVGLFFIGVPSPVLWGIMGMLLRFVPYVGSFIAAVLPVALGAAVDPGWSMALWTLALFVVTEGVIGQAVEPLVYGHSTGLSPVAVIVVAIFWSWLWGPIGLILSTPLTLCLVVLGRHVKRLEFFDILLGDRPALTPVETFYQRLLAHDPDEVLEQAETLLKGRALSSYYDDIALKGLQLAANDVARGVLPDTKVEAIRTDLLGLVEELDGHDDDEPEDADEADTATVVAGASDPQRETPRQSAPEGSAPPEHSLPEPWRTDTAILCVAGRGPLDEVAAAMLAQLLHKHGLGASVVAHQAVSRSAVSSLDPSGVAMVCISYLEIAGNPSHLRYLLRRIRQRLPGCPILVGLWPVGDSFLADNAMRAATGGDHYVSSLHEAVEACLTEAHRSATPTPHRSAA